MNETTQLTEVTMGHMDEPKVPLSERLLIGLLYLLLKITGLIGYGIVILGFIRDHKEYAKVPFYKLLYSLAIGDVGMLLMQLMMVPVVFTGEPLYGQGTLFYTLGFIDRVCFYIIIYSSLFITLNRFAIFMLPPSHDLVEFFFESHMNKICMLPLLFALSMSLGAAHFGIMLIYSHRKFNWTWRFLGRLPPIGYLFLNLMVVQSVVVPLGMFCMYVVVFLKLRFGKWRPSQQGSELLRQRANRELRLLLQSVIICTLLEGVCLSFHLPISGVLANVFGIVNSAATPYILLVFNKLVRTSAKKLCGIAENKVDVVVVSSQQPNA